jgi:hypothetical protein
MNYNDPTIAHPEHECMECGIVGKQVHYKRVVLFGKRVLEIAPFFLY